MARALDHKSTKVSALIASVTTVAVVLLMSPGMPASAAGSAPKPSDLSAKQLSPSDRVTATKSLTGQLARTPGSLLNKQSPRLINVMIKFDYDGTASYQGGIAGLPATSPSVTDQSLTARTSAKSTYLRYIKSNERSTISGLESAVPRIQVGQRFRVVYGGVSARVPANSVNRMLKVPGVVAIQRDAVHQPLTDSSPDFLNATEVYNKLGTTANAGAGVIYGNLDTGVWPEHPSFADQGNLSAPPGPARACDFGDNPLTPANDPFVCQNKLIGGASFTQTYDTFNNDNPYPGLARDGEGHGSHTASTSAGNMVDNVSIEGGALPDIHGIAPGAWVMEYKVCGGPQGCYSSDSVAAIGQAITDGVQVINYSISGGDQPFTDPVELAFLDAYAANVFVSASAGNDGPDAGTTAHRSPWVTTVAASTQTREFFTSLSLSAGNGDTFEADGASVTPGVGPAPVAMASDAPYSHPLCDVPATPGSLTGMIVACQRGTNARVEKSFNIRQGGAVGMILFNPSLADVETDNHWLPTVHLADGTDFKNFMSTHSSVTGSWPDSARRNGQGDVMAAFSSRGPGGLFLKPDVTAPGVQILGAMTPTPDEVSGGPPGQYYQAIAGTSMSSPHVAGAALLLLDRHPNWTPGQVKSALMTTALTSVVKEDLTTPATPFDDGAGRIDIGLADNAPLTISDSASNMALLGDDPLQSINLNIPSINAPIVPGLIVTTRTLKNTSGHSLTVGTSAVSPAQSSITVKPKSFSIPAGGSKTIQVTITSNAQVGQQLFGSVNLSARSSLKHGSVQMHLPVAFIHTQGSVSLDQSCAGTKVRLGKTVDCTVTATNHAFEDADVDLTTQVSDRLRVSAVTGATMVGTRKAHLATTLSGAQLGVPDVSPGLSPAGYIPLSLFGITPDAIGDEQILNYNVAPFVYNGETYTRIGVDSNGYVVAGGASGGDNNCCNLPSGPDPEAPNNMLAPFWTDMDGTNADGIRAADLTDGVNHWLVIEYQVDLYGTSDLVTFQVWIGVNGTQDISYAYDPANLPPQPLNQDYLVGAENPAGAGDMSRFLPTEDLVVTSSDPAPGASATYVVTVRGVQKGQADVTTSMTSNIVPGVTIEKDPLPVW